MKLKNGPFPPSYMRSLGMGLQDLLHGAHSHSPYLIFLPCIHRH